MTTNPPDESDAPVDAAAAEASAGDGTVAEAGTEEASPASEFASRVAGLVGSSSWSADFGNPKVDVAADGWVEAVRTVRDEAGLDFFSFLSAVDWSNDVAVGEPLEESVEERFEVLVRLSSGRTNEAVTLSTAIPKDEARLPTLIEVFGGADWHEREAAEMFGIEFVGHPNLSKLYLTDEFEGHPLRKDYPLLSREVKPWPGMVDVEDMPSTENPEAGSTSSSEDAAGNQQSAVGSEEAPAEGGELSAGDAEGGAQ
ncbi:MAG: NADH-quinone oxidoreductase subunit C [Acidimicrobiia bacterium]|nr:NADH-quinone oxidoreductase subunit C [Acidimicrobiia bacterium]MBT8216898.1 NADH-quinone oxidoreductase subunit C [Acidimicrobiia bacterium]NNF10463.1 NADH-quinone oxidoreductase subunit C [Acidimicrobiia bacterium]NNL68801.1 NADH-quinone oxidoreductase subunit C [Acidimicrobiia bacterium]